MRIFVIHNIIYKIQMHLRFYLPLKFGRIYESLTAKEKLTVHEDYDEMHLIRCYYDGKGPVKLKFYSGKPIKDDEKETIPFQITMIGNANTREACTEFRLNIDDDEVLCEEWLMECVEYIRKKIPTIERIIFSDVMEEPDNLMRSIALNGQSYIEMFFNVRLHKCDASSQITSSMMTHEEYEEISEKYVSESFKMEYSWNMFIARYPLISEYESALSRAYASSRRMVDFMRTTEEILPKELFYELCKEVVAKEYGNVSRSWLYDIHQPLVVEQTTASSPHCCACEGCFDNPKGCPAGYRCISSCGDYPDSDSDSSEEEEDSLKIKHTEGSIKSDLDEADINAWHHSPTNSCPSHSDHE